ncbi:hypothetical protein IJX73_03620 [bacterium]|nr:hypothetical protein [bacterium]
MKIQPYSNNFYSKQNRKNSLPIKQNNRQNFKCSKNIQNAYYLPFINFTSLKVKEANLPDSSASFEFGLNLYQRAVKGEEIDIKKEIESFLDKEQIDKVEIDYANKKMGYRGVFQSKFTKDREYNGGIIYIDEFPKTKNKKEIQLYCSTLAHELQHAKQHKTQSAKPVFIDASDTRQIDTIYAYVNFLRPTISSTLQQTPLGYFFINYKKIDVPNYECAAISQDIRRYGTFFSQAKTRKLDDDFIYSSFGGKENFKEQVRETFDATIEKFNEGDFSKDYRNKKTYDLLRKFYIHELRSEAQAYQIEADINNSINGIPSRFKTLNNIIPMTYALVADELENLEI